MGLETQLTKLKSNHISMWVFFFKAMGLMLLPHNAPDAAKNVAYMVDEIWYHAGDTSTDVCS